MAVNSTKAFFHENVIYSNNLYKSETKFCPPSEMNLVRKTPKLHDNNSGSIGCWSVYKLYTRFIYRLKLIKNKQYSCGKPCQVYVIIPGILRFFQKNNHPLRNSCFWVHVLSLIQTLCELQSHFSFVLAQNICQVGYQYHMHVHQHAYHTGLLIQVIYYTDVLGFTSFYNHLSVILGSILGLFSLFIGTEIFHCSYLCKWNFIVYNEVCKHNVRISNPPFW